MQRQFCTSIVSLHWIHYQMPQSVGVNILVSILAFKLVFSLQRHSWMRVVTQTNAGWLFQILFLFPNLCPDDDGGHHVMPLAKDSQLSGELKWRFASSALRSIAFRLALHLLRWPPVDVPEVPLSRSDVLLSADTAASCHQRTAVLAASAPARTRPSAPSTDRSLNTDLRRTPAEQELTNVCHAQITVLRPQIPARVDDECSK